jgi:hypothetical protein
MLVLILTEICSVLILSLRLGYSPYAQRALSLFYATLAYISHFIFAGCYDLDPWYIVTNLAGHLELAGHLDLAGFYFLNAPLNLLLCTRDHYHNSLQI